MFCFCSCTHSGAPQGSVLGSIIFSMYIKPLTSIIHPLYHTPRNIMVCYSLRNKETRRARKQNIKYTKQHHTPHCWLPAKVMYPTNSTKRFLWLTCSTPKATRKVDETSRHKHSINTLEKFSVYLHMEINKNENTDMFMFITIYFANVFEGVYIIIF